MVNFDKLGARAGDDGYPPIDDEWHDLSDRRRAIIRALVKHPEKTQGEIGEIADVTPRAVHDVVYSLPSEQFKAYKQNIIEESTVSLDPQNATVGEDETITVSAPMRMLVQVSIPRKDLETATTAAMGQDAIVTAVEPDSSN